MVRSLPVALLGSLLLGSAALAASPPQFPYKASVNAEDVYVRSGPGEDYYPTEKLKLGQEVEVYRHDPGGWYAIRPPEGSFTWVAARYLDVQRDGLATVNSERVAGRVGSRFSDIREVIQVRLQKGETVEILGRDARQTQGEKGWCKIAPPSGEFRWISGKYVDTDFPRDGLRRNSAVEPASATSPVAEPAASPPAATAPAEPPAKATVAVTPVKTAPAEAAPADDAPPVAETAPLARLDAEQFRKELEDLELELSIMVAEEPTVWTFDRIGPRARALLEQAGTAVERGRARMLVNKVSRFEEIRSRMDAVSKLRKSTDRQNDQLADLSRKRADALRVPISVDGRYDGVGKLTRVPATLLGTPRYALVDTAGEIRCYVTPAPGVNLQNYVGRDVGIHGVRGFMPEQKAQHIVAKHVTAIEETKVR